MGAMRDELRDELVAVLGASRELKPEADERLAEMFLERLQGPGTKMRRGKEVAPHQPHYSLVLVGALWGVAPLWLLSFPWYSYTHAVDGPDRVGFTIFCLGVLLLLALVTRAFLYLARYGWHLPRIRVNVAPPQSKMRG